MERRRALVVAGTMAATLAMAGTAMAVNMGLLSSDSDAVGNLTATEIQPAAQREPRVRVVVQDIPVPLGGTTSSSGSSTGTVESDDDAPAATTASAPSAAPAPYVDDDDSGYDDHGDDDGYDDHGDDDSVDEPDEPGDDD